MTLYDKIRKKKRFWLFGLYSDLDLGWRSLKICLVGRRIISNHSMNFYKDLVSSFLSNIINRHTDRQTDTDESIIFLAEVVTVTADGGYRDTFAQTPLAYVN